MFRYDKIVTKINSRMTLFSGHSIIIGWYIVTLGSQFHHLYVGKWNFVVFKIPSSYNVL